MTEVAGDLRAHSSSVESSVTPSSRPGEPIDDSGGPTTLDDVYLEETYVRAIRVGRDVRVDLDCALLPGHHLYTAPAAGSVNTYVGASLFFRTVTRIEWDDPSDVVYSDGEASWIGELDEFAHDRDGCWRIPGAYGSLRIWAADVEVRWADPET